MNDPDITWHILWILLAAVTGILAWLGRRHIERLDDLDREAVRHHDLKELEERLTSDRIAMHVSNQQRFQEIREDIKDLSNSVERALLHRGGGR